MIPGDDGDAVALAFERSPDHELVSGQHEAIDLLRSLARRRLRAAPARKELALVLLSSCPRRIAVQLISILDGQDTREHGAGAQLDAERRRVQVVLDRIEPALRLAGEANP